MLFDPNWYLSKIRLPVEYCVNIILWTVFLVWNSFFWLLLKKNFFPNLWRFCPKRPGPLLKIVYGQNWDLLLIFLYLFNLCVSAFWNTTDTTFTPTTATTTTTIASSTSTTDNGKILYFLMSHVNTTRNTFDLESNLHIFWCFKWNNMNVSRTVYLPLKHLLTKMQST